MASLNGAKVLNLDHNIGIISTGKDAYIVILDEDFSVYMTISRGRIVYEK